MDTGYDNITYIKTDNTGLNFKVDYVKRIFNLSDLKLESVIYRINSGKDLVQYITVYI